MHMYAEVRSVHPTEKCSNYNTHELRAITRMYVGLLGSQIIDDKRCGIVLSMTIAVKHRREVC